MAFSLALSLQPAGCHRPRPRIADAVERAIDTLRTPSASPGERRAALALLAGAARDDRRAQAALGGALLGDSPDSERADAARAIGRLMDGREPWAADTLRAALATGVTAAKIAAAEGAASAGPAATPLVPDLMALVPSATRAVASAAAGALGAIGEPGLRPLALALGDARPAVREAAFLGLAAAPPDLRAAQTSRVVEALTRETADVAGRAGAAFLASLPAPAAVAAARDLLIDQDTDLPSTGPGAIWGLRALTAVLGTAGAAPPPQACASLVPCIGDVVALLPQPGTTVHRLATGIVEACPREAGPSLLRELVNDTDPAGRLAAVNLLGGHATDPDVRDALSAAAERDPDRAVRQAAQASLLAAPPL